MVIDRSEENDPYNPYPEGPKIAEEMGFIALQLPICFQLFFVGYVNQLLMHSLLLPNIW
jgi:hypothetical protein